MNQFDLPPDLTVKFPYSILFEFLHRIRSLTRL